MPSRNSFGFSPLLPGLILFSCAAGPGNTETPRPRQGAALVTQLQRQNDAGIADQLARQQRDPNQPGFGGIANAHGLYHAGSVSGLIRNLSCAYTSAPSRYSDDPQVLAALDAAAEFMLQAQHADGTIDLLTTNFHSPPDTGFILEWMCSSALLLRQAGQPAAAPVLKKLLEFIRRGADALAVGGVHTPNHRWVVCMALARANQLLPDPRYVQRIDTWLGEHIDIDADGQFTERSTSIYSPLTDRCLLTVARLLDRPDLLEPVRRNLEMSLFYRHADGEVVTEGSRRQDQYQRSSMLRYYYAYRYMAQHDRNPRFAAMVHDLEQRWTPQLTGNLVYFLETPQLAGPLPEPHPLPSDYERHFRHSDLVRIRRGELSATILAGNPICLSVHRGGAAVVLRFASAFFGKGQFVGEKLHKEGDSWVMYQDLSGPYYQPIAAQYRRADGDWLKMPKHLRATSEVQHQHAELRISEQPGGLDVEISITGTAGVPVAIELGCRPSDRVDGATPRPSDPSSLLLSSGHARISAGLDRIRVGPGRTEHHWTQLRGALAKLAGNSLYLTGSTPFRHTLRFR